MNKLLHERLRETANTCRFVRTKGFQCYLSKDLACELADEVEKYYIPRPRFEGGEPIQGDRLFNSPIDYYYVYNDGSWVVYLVDDNGEDNGELSGHASDFVRLPESKALDADGVEINVGETLYRASHAFGAGKEVHVYGIGHIKDAPHSEIQVFTTPECTLRSGWEIPSNLTHREPDSLEKLRDDMREFVDTEYKIPGGTKTNEWLDRLTDIMERDA